MPGARPGQLPGVARPSAPPTPRAGRPALHATLTSPRATTHMSVSYLQRLASLCTGPSWGRPCGPDSDGGKGRGPDSGGLPSGKQELTPQGRGAQSTDGTLIYLINAASELLTPLKTFIKKSLFSKPRSSKDSHWGRRDQMPSARRQVTGRPHECSHCKGSDACTFCKLICKNISSSNTAPPRGLRREGPELKRKWGHGDQGTLSPGGAREEKGGSAANLSQLLMGVLWSPRSPLAGVTKGASWLGTLLGFLPTP